MTGSSSGVRSRDCGKAPALNLHVKMFACVRSDAGRMVQNGALQHLHGHHETRNRQFSQVSKGQRGAALTLGVLGLSVFEKAR